MFKLINTIIARYFRKNRQSKIRKELKQEIYENIFKINGEGIYYMNFKGTSNNIISKIIQYFSGNLTHSFIVLYSENIHNYFTNEEWDKCCKKWNYYYGINTGIPSDLKCFVMGSADQDGINYFDYANYQTRIQSIRKAQLNEVQIQRLCKWLLQPKTMDANYDYAGLALWPLRKIFKKADVKSDLYCSELVYDAFISVGVKVAKESEPSPKTIEEYNKNWIVYSNL